MEAENKEQRKEVFDYLRQLQKLEEQSAKVSGMNNWVLIAATCYLVAWLLENFVEHASKQVFTVGLALGLCLYLLRTLVLPGRLRTLATGTRLTQFVDEDPSMAGLNFCLIGLAPVIPTIASYMLVGWSFAVAFGVLSSIVLAIAYVVGPLVKDSFKGFRILSVNSNDKKLNVLGPILALVALAIHSYQMLELITHLSKDELTFAGHVTALWWLLWQLARTVNSAATMKQYAHMEEALIFGIATPAEILKRLEFRAFGPSLEQELTDFQKEIESAVLPYKSALSKFNEALESTKTVPQEYEIEIAGRIEAAFKPVESAGTYLVTCIDAKAKYIETLMRLNAKKLPADTLKLLARQADHSLEELKQLRTELRNIKTHVNSGK